MNISTEPLSKSILKYTLQGLAVALSISYIPSGEIDRSEIVSIALTAAAVYALLDTFFPSVAKYARKGTGFFIGMNLLEPYSNESDCGCSGNSSGPKVNYNAAVAFAQGPKTGPRSNPSPPFGLKSIYRGNNIFTRNVNPGPAENGEPMPYNS
jgi:hypothetical protein